MAAIETTYGNGGVQTNTQGIPLTSGGDLNSVLAELVRRRLQTQPMAVMEQPRMMAAQREPMRVASVAAPAPKSALQRAQEHAAILQLRQGEQGAPLRYTNGGYGSPTTAGHLEMDDQHMTPGQRRAFLPNDAGMADVSHGQGMSGDEYEQNREKLMRLEAQLTALGKQAQREDAGLWNPYGAGK